VRINASFVNVFKKPNSRSEVITQLLYGETFKIIGRKKLFIKIKNDLDNYKGYILKKNICLNLINTHKVYKLNASLYNKPDFKKKIKKKIKFGSKIKILKKKNKFYKFNNFRIKKKKLKKIKYK